MFARYKAQVAPLYRNQLDQHLFATASPHERVDTFQNSAKAWREWLRDRWSRRWNDWMSASAAK